MYFKIYLWVYVSCVQVCAMWVQVPLETRSQSPWSWNYRSSWVARYGCWEPNLDLLQEYQVLLTSEASLLPPQCTVTYTITFEQDNPQTQGCIISCASGLNCSGLEKGCKVKNGRRATTESLSSHHADSKPRSTLSSLANTEFQVWSLWLIPCVPLLLLAGPDLRE